MAKKLLSFCFILLKLVLVDSDPDLSFSIHCEEHRLVGQWEMPKNETREILITLIDTSCNSTNTSTNIDGSPRSFTITDDTTNTTTMNITSMFSECQTTINESSSSVLVTNTALLQVTDTLTTLSDYYHYEIFCELPRDVVLSSGDNVHHNISNNIIVSKVFNASKIFSLSISMEFYKDDTFSTEYGSSPLSVNINDDIFVGIKEEIVNPSFKFIVNQCYASDTSSPTDGVSDIFFDNKCSLDGTFSIKSAENSNDTFNFAIQAFGFIEDKKSIYFHCRVFVCLTDSADANCVQTCDATGARWKRGIQSNNSPLQEVVVNSPKIIFNAKRTCDEMSCPKNSDCHSLEPAICLCRTGFVYSHVSKQCISERINVIKNVFLDLPWNPAYKDSSSKEYRKFVFRYENLLYRLFMATFSYNDIEGVKIIKMNRGGVILDVALIHTVSSSSEQAYLAFINSLRTNYVKAARVLQLIKFVEVNQPVWRPTSRKKDKVIIMRYWIIGAGAFAALIVILVTVIYTIRRMKTGKMEMKTKTVHSFENKGMQCKEP